MTSTTLLINKSPSHKFWKEYEQADILEREEKLKPIIKSFEHVSGLKDKEKSQDLLKIMLLTYFDDLLEYKYSKQ